MSVVGNADSLCILVIMAQVGFILMHLCFFLYFYMLINPESVYSVYTLFLGLVSMFKYFTWKKITRTIMFLARVQQDLAGAYSELMFLL